MPKPSQIPTYASPSFLVYRDAVPDVDGWSFVVYQTEGGAEKRRKDMERYRRGRLARAGMTMGVAVFIVGLVMGIFSLASETTVAPMVFGACAWMVLMIPFFIMEAPCYRLARIEAHQVYWAIQDRNPTFSSTVIDAALDSMPEQNAADAIAAIALAVRVRGSASILAASDRATGEICFAAKACQDDPTLMARIAPEQAELEALLPARLTANVQDKSTP